MRKLLPAIALLISYTYYGQQQVFSLEPALGVNAAQVHGDGYSGYNKPGLFAGAGVNFRLSEKGSLQFGLYLTQKGARHNASIKNPADNTIVWRVDFIDAPLTYRYQLNEKFHGLMGLSAAFLFHDKYLVNKAATFYNPVYNKFEANISFGLGLMMNEKTVLELRCTNGFTPFESFGIKSTVYYSNPVARFFNKGYYNNILTLFVGYKIVPKKHSGE